MKKHLLSLFLALSVLSSFGQTSSDSTFRVPPGGTYFFRSPFTRSFQSLGLDSHINSVIMDGLVYKSYVPGRMINDFTGFTAGHGYQIARKPVSVDTATIVLSPASVFSSNAFLSGLVVPGVTLTPTFAQSTFTYTASVANSVTSITVTPTLAESHATVRVNGTAVASGATSQAITLTTGANTTPVAVTAQNNITAQNYNLIITRALPGSIVTPVVTHTNISSTSGTINFASSNPPTGVIYTVTVNGVSKGAQTTGYIITGLSANQTVNVSVVASAPGYNTSVAGTDSFVTNTTSATYNLMMIADSKGAGYLGTDPTLSNGNTGAVSHQGTSAPIAIAYGLLDHNIFTNVFNAAVSGSTVAQQAGWAASQVDTHFSSTYSNNVAIIETGVNSLTIEKKTPTQVYNELVAYHLARQAAGWSTVVETVAGSWYNGDQTGITPTPLAQIWIKQLDALERDGWQRDMHAIGIIDVGADSHVGMVATSPDFTYMNADGLHNTNLGYSYVGTNYEAPALQSIASTGTYGVVTPILSTPANVTATASGANVIIGSSAVSHATGYNIYSNSTNTQNGETTVATNVSLPYTYANQSSSSKYYFVEATATSGYGTSLPASVSYTAAATLQPFTLGAATSLTVSGTDILGATTGATDAYAGTGTGVVKLPVGVDGEIRATYASDANKAAILGLRTTNANSGYSDYAVAFLMADGVLYVMNNGANQGAPGYTSGFNTIGTFRLRIVGTVITIDVSRDSGSTFTTLYTYTVSRTTDLYIGLNIDTGKKLSNVQTLGFVTF